MNYGYVRTSQKSHPTFSSAFLAAGRHSLSMHWLCRSPPPPPYFASHLFWQTETAAENAWCAFPVQPDK